MLLQLNPKIKILSRDEHSCKMLLNGRKIVLHGRGYEKYLYPLINKLRTVIDLDQAWFTKNYKTSEASEVRTIIDKLLKKKILIFVGYEKIKGQNKLRILLVNFTHDDLKKELNIQKLFSKNKIDYITSDSLALECDNLQKFKIVLKKISSDKKYDIICPIFWYLCPKIIKDLNRYTNYVIPVISNSNYFSYGPIISENNLNDSLLSLNTEEHRYRYVDYHFSRQIKAMPLVFLANEINQWQNDDQSQIYDCNIWNTICSYNYNSQVFRKKHIVWVRKYEN